MNLTKADKWKLSLLLLLWFAVFYPIVPEMVKEWSSHSDNNHGFLVPLIALYFVWQERDNLQASELDSSTWGAVVLIGSLLIYILSYTGGIAFPARVAMVFALAGLIWFCLGAGWMRILSFPVFFLLFMIPVPYSLMGQLTIPLQLMATKVSANIIAACAIPVYREGNMLFFQGTQLEVAEACSGIRSIMSLTMLGTIFAYMARSGWPRRVVLVLAAVPVAIVANIIRITGTGILANYYGDKVAKGFLHEFSGLAVFAFGILSLGLFYTVLNRDKGNDAE